MTSETKRHIDSARQVLVGVVPNPSSQIDQITNALIYKFMDDMDQAAIKQGGEPSFFVGDLKQYSWTRLMDSRVGNQERMNIYVEALLKFSESKQLPQLFRDIFKSAFLPYRSPEVLGLFLKEISYFDYSHPEELGNAYEYLLSIMSSQGDAGQFRTPRHIIDFIVEAVNPTIEDKVLDPACGTGGFLVSAYNHVLKQHDGKDDLDKKEKPLTPDQRKNLANNFEGYDIDPTMVRIAQVNMYLHQFKNPKIFQYDSLSMDERWGDKFSVILANPPFMSPKGGVSTHSKFSIQSTRSEVLFVDYIMNHLRPNGKAGIIVPEGIIFQSGTAHKQLRKNLVEDGLYAVVSLPSGVFAPYSGVKTSILLFNNELAKKSTEILFIKIENDGFDLGAQRRTSTKNDLPTALDILNDWNTGKKVPNKLVVYVEKSKITESGDYNLSGDRYRVATDYSNAKWSMVGFDDVVSTITPPVKILKEHFKTEGSFPIIDQSQDEIAGWTNDEATLVKSEKPLVIFGDHTCAVKYTEKSFAQGADGIKILLTNDQLIPKYLYYILKTKPVESEGYQRHFAKLRRYEIPLPPLEIQEQIVAELDGYAGIIAGVKQITQNWKPTIDVDPEWKKVKLEEVADVTAGQSPEGKFYNDNNKGTPFYQGKTEFGDIYIGKPKKWTTQITKLADKGDILMSVRAPVGPVNISTENICIGRGIAGIKSRKIEQMFLFTYLQMIEKEIVGNGGAVFDSINKSQIEQIEIPLPSTEIQKQIVGKIEAERALVESAKKLIDIYEQKTKEAIAKLWAE